MYSFDTSMDELSTEFDRDMALISAHNGKISFTEQSNSFDVDSIILVASCEFLTRIVLTF